MHIELEQHHNDFGNRLMDIPAKTFMFPRNLPDKLDHFDSSFASASASSFLGVTKIWNTQSMSIDLSYIFFTLSEIYFISFRQKSINKDTFIYYFCTL